MKKLLIFILLIISLTAQATTYYVRTDGDNGHDGLSNSSSGAWLTLAYACAHTTVGDIINVGVGTFNETSQCVLGLRVSIIGQGVTSIIKSSYSGSYATGILTVTSAAGNPINGNQSISYLEFDGNNQTNTVAISSSYRNNVTISNCTFINYSARAVSFDNGGGYMTAPTYNYSTGNSVHDCIITNIGKNEDSNYPNYGSVWWYGQSGFLLYNNTMNNTTRTYNSDLMKGAWFSGAKIYNNTFTKPTGDNGGSWNFFSEFFFMTGGGTEFYGNIFNGNAALDFNGALPGTAGYSCKIYNNTWTMASQSSASSHGTMAIDLESWPGFMTDIYIYNNHFKNSTIGVQLDANGGQISSATGFQKIYIYYNIFENIGNTTNSYSPAISLKPQGTNSLISYDQIYIDNNTIVSGPTYKGYVGVLLQTCSAMTNIYCRNNIIKDFDLNAIRYYMGTGTPSGSTHYIQNNIAYGNGYNNVGFSGVTVTGINYTPASGFYSTSNPLFVSTSDFHLQSGSPAISNGIYAGYTTDYAGSVVNNPPEIGVYEYGSISNILMTAFTLSSAGNATTITTYHGTLQFSTSGITPSNTTDQTFTWSVTNGTGSATISSSGLLTAVTNGTVTVRATAHDGSGIYNTIVTTLSNQTVTGYPVVITTILTDVTPTTATLGGNVTSDGGLTVTNRGLCYNASANPTTGNSVIQAGTGTGAFTATITGLTVGGTYHVRAFATNSTGTSYGADIQVTTRAKYIVTF
jgi:hypothetical protein